MIQILITIYEDEMDSMSYSPYFLPICLSNNLINSKSFFWIVSLNAGSLSTKFDSQIWLVALSSQNIHFPMKRIQESWISNEIACFHMNDLSITHASVIIYVDNIYMML